MSDYLDNLFARSCNLIEVIQPRPISLFEPPRGMTWSPSDRLPALETAEDKSALGERTLNALEITRPAARHSGVLSASPDVHVGPPGPQPSPAPHRWDGTQPEPLCLQPEPGLVQPISSPTSGTLALAASTRIAESVPQRPSIGRPEPAPAGIAAAGSDVPHEAVEGAIRPAVEPAVERTVIERIVPLATPPPTQAVSTSSQAAPPRRMPEPESCTAVGAAIPQPGPATPAPIIARPHVRPYQRPAPSSATPPAAQPEPTIQVTIGRIEVRAVPPPAPPKRATPPVMSLDDYLRQRNGGRR